MTLLCVSFTNSIYMFTVLGYTTALIRMQKKDNSASNEYIYVNKLKRERERERERELIRYDESGRL